MRSATAFFLTVFVGAYLATSSASAASANHDYRYIDQPFGPVENERVLKFSADAQFGERNENLSSADLIEGNIEFQQSLNDEFALVWSPLPLGVIIRDASQVGIDQSACEWSIGYSNLGEYGIQPRFDGYLRRATATGQAIEANLDYYSFFPFGRFPNRWSASLAADYVFQIGRSVAVSPGLALSLNDNVLTAARDNDSSYESQFKFVFPLLARIDFRLSSSVHLRFDYLYRGLGLNETDHVHTILIEPSIRW